MSWKKEEKSLSQYWDMLARHDWYYDYSDDHSVWRAGVKSEDALKLYRHDSEDHKRLYDEFHAYHVARLRGERAALPPRPEI